MMICNGIVISTISSPMKAEKVLYALRLLKRAGVQAQDMLKVYRCNVSRDRSWNMPYKCGRTFLSICLKEQSPCRIVREHMS